MRLVLFPLLACLFTSLCAPALASVVLTGTRVIYPAEAAGQTLQLSNADAHPYLVQMWLDAGDQDSTPETVAFDAPFTLSPPIFRMEPGSGQAVRLMFNGDQALPADRESLFYLNFTQIPALAQDTLEANLLVLTLKSRVKLLYRPHGLPRPNLSQIACALRFDVHKDALEVENPGAFHAVVRRAELLLDGHAAPLIKAEVLAPFSRREWLLPEPLAASSGAQLRVTLVNDYGADESHTCPWR